MCLAACRDQWSCPQSFRKTEFRRSHGLVERHGRQLVSSCLHLGMLKFSVEGGAPGIDDPYVHRLARSHVTVDSNSVVRARSAEAIRFSQYFMIAADEGLSTLDCHAIQ